MKKIESMDKIKQVLFLVSLILPTIAIYGQAQQASGGYTLKKSSDVNGLIVTDYYFRIEQLVASDSLLKSMPKRDRLARIVEIAIASKSDSIVVQENNELLYTAIVLLYPQKVIRVTDARSGEIKSYALDLRGDITANRAIELVEGEYDKKRAATRDGYLYFNDSTYKIIAYDDIQAKLLSLIISSK